MPLLALPRRPSGQGVSSLALESGGPLSLLSLPILLVGMGAIIGQLQAQSTMLQVQYSSVQGHVMYCNKVYCLG